MTSPRRRSGRRAHNISTLCAQHPVTHNTGVYLAGSPERLLPSDGLRSSGIGPLSSLWDPHLSARFLGSTSLFLSATTSQQTRLPRALLPLHTGASSLPCCITNPCCLTQRSSVTGVAAVSRLARQQRSQAPSPAVHVELSRVPGRLLLCCPRGWCLFTSISMELAWICHH